MIYFKQFKIVFSKKKKGQLSIIVYDNDVSEGVDDWEGYDDFEDADNQKGEDGW